MSQPGSACGIRWMSQPHVHWSPAALDTYEMSGTDDSATVHVQEDLVEMPGNRHNRPPLIRVPVQIHRADQMQHLMH